MGKIILQAQQLGKSYGKHEVLKDVSFSLEEGEIRGVIGENGAGKSTLLSILATIQKPSHGTVLFDGENIITDRKAYRSQMGYVPQEIALFDELSGYDNLLFFGKSYHIPADLLKERVREVCEITEFPEEWLNGTISKYSGGMRRKINIGAALLHHPKLLLLDEPVANLDPEAEEQVLCALKKLSLKGTSIIYVGHQMEQMEQLCDSICFIKQGRQVHGGSMDEVLCRGTERISLKQLWKETVGKGSKE